MSAASEKTGLESADRTHAFLAEVSACWRQLPNKGLFLGLLAVWVALFHLLGNSTFGYIDTPSLFKWMYNAYTGTGSDDSHGLLIPLVVLVLFYAKRKELLALPLVVWWPGLVLFAFAAALHIFGYVLQQPRISIIAMFTGLYALMGLAWGPAFMRRSLFPFFLFVFCIPLGSMTERITFPLRLLVAKVVTGISQMALGLEVMRDGTMLSNAVEGYKYDVAPACSGIRSLVATFAIATIYAFTSFREHWKRALLVGSAFPLAVLGNIFRMMIIVLAAETFGEKAGANVHQNEFWSLLPYVPAILGLLLLGRWLEKPGPKPPATAEAKSP